MSARLRIGASCSSSVLVLVAVALLPAGEYPAIPGPALASIRGSDTGQPRDHEIDCADQNLGSFSYGELSCAQSNQGQAQ